MQDDNDDLTQEISDMWETMRAEDRMIEDLPGIKIGAPSPDVYAVYLPVENDGVFSMLSLSIEAAEALGNSLLHVLGEARDLTAKAEAGIVADDAIYKAKRSM